MNERVFWLVWEPGSGQTHTQHDTEVAACDEAKRLARANNGKRFYVLRATAHYAYNAIQETIFLDPECPF